MEIREDFLAKNDSVAQLVEHNTFNVRVLGSSPSGITFIQRFLTGREVYPDEQSDIGKPQRDHSYIEFLN